MIGLVVTLIVVGVLLWAEETYIPVAQPIKMIIRVVVVIAVILYVLAAFGLIPFNMPVPRLR